MTMMACIDWSPVFIHKHGIRRSQIHYIKTKIDTPSFNKICSSVLRRPVAEWGYFIVFLGVNEQFRALIQRVAVILNRALEIADDLGGVYEKRRRCEVAGDSHLMRLRLPGVSFEIGLLNRRFELRRFRIRVQPRCGIPKTIEELAPILVEAGSRGDRFALHAIGVALTQGAPVDIFSVRGMRRQTEFFHSSARRGDAKSVQPMSDDLDMQARAAKRGDARGAVTLADASPTVEALLRVARFGDFAARACMFMALLLGPKLMGRYVTAICRTNLGFKIDSLPEITSMLARGDRAARLFCSRIRNGDALLQLSEFIFERREVSPAWSWWAV
jgi:hypothetical protein